MLTEAAVHTNLSWNRSINFRFCKGCLPISGTFPNFVRNVLERTGDDKNVHFENGLDCLER